MLINADAHLLLLRLRASFVEVLKCWKQDFSSLFDFEGESFLQFS